MQKYIKYVKICKNHPRHLYKFLLPPGRVPFPVEGCRTPGEGGRTQSFHFSADNTSKCGYPQIELSSTAHRLK